MSKLNTLFEEVCNEMDKIKTNQSDIEMSDLIEFSSMYFNCQNWVLDLINHITIKKKNTDFITKYDNEINIFFLRINQYNYNRLIIDTLIELKTEKSIAYLKEIINNSPKNKKLFINDFKGHWDFKEIMNTIE